MVGPARKSWFKPLQMPPRRMGRPIERLTKVLSIDPDELRTIRIGIKQRTDEGRLILRNFVFAIADSDFPVCPSSNLRHAFSSGAQ